ncbi:MAG: hypothetical protein AAGJ28_13405 [Pseudomonadota bacterium]
MTRACTLIASIVTASLLAGTASAQAPTRPEILQPEQMFETLRKLMDQMKPQIDDALKMMQDFEHLDDPRNYHLPEVQPNGDIIIRRREGAPDFRQKAPTDEEQVEPKDGVRT